MATTATSRRTVARKNCRSYLRPGKRFDRLDGTAASIDKLPFQEPRHVRVQVDIEYSEIKKRMPIVYRAAIVTRWDSIALLTLTGHNAHREIARDPSGQKVSQERFQTSLRCPFWPFGCTERWCWPKGDLAT